MAASRGLARRVNARMVTMKTFMIVERWIERVYTWVAGLLLDL